MAPSRSRPETPVIERFDAALEFLDLGQHAMGVLQRQLALRREAEIAMAALDDRRAKLLLELPDRRRQRRLRDVAGFGGAAEMLLARQRHKIFELTDHHRGDAKPAPSPLSTAGARRPLRSKEAPCRSRPNPHSRPASPF